MAGHLPHRGRQVVALKNYNFPSQFDNPPPICYDAQNEVNIMPNCNGNCASCSGCARELVLTEKEIEFLMELGQVAFLPVARKMGDLEPVYLEAGEANKEQYSLLLQILEKKGLISLDFDKPLRGFDEKAYAAYPIRGSMALTERGHKVLELLEVQGISL